MTPARRTSELWRSLHASAEQVLPRLARLPADEVVLVGNSVRGQGVGEFVSEGGEVDVEALGVEGGGFGLRSRKMRGVGVDCCARCSDELDCPFLDAGAHQEPNLLHVEQVDLHAPVNGWPDATHNGACPRPKNICVEHVQ